MGFFLDAKSYIPNPGIFEIFPQKDQLNIRDFKKVAVEHMI